MMSDFLQNVVSFESETQAPIGPQPKAKSLSVRDKTALFYKAAGIASNKDLINFIFQLAKEVPETTNGGLVANAYRLSFKYFGINIDELMKNKKGAPPVELSVPDCWL